MLNHCLVEKEHPTPSPGSLQLLPSIGARRKTEAPCKGKQPGQTAA